MGCFPDRTLPQYKTFENQRNNASRRSADPNKNIDSIYVPIDVKDIHINSKAQSKVIRSPKKVRAQPVEQVKPEQPGKFSRRQLSSVMKIDPDKQRRLTRKKVGDERIGAQRKKGHITKLPYREHAITELQTPSQSIHTSVLANFQNNPSIFFLKMSQKDMDAIFKSSFKDRKEEKYQRMQYKSMSPLHIQKQPSG